MLQTDVRVIGETLLRKVKEISLTPRVTKVRDVLIITVICVLAVKECERERNEAANWRAACQLGGGEPMTQYTSDGAEETCQ